MDLQNIPTYHAGIAQSKAHRALKQLTDGLLKKHHLTMMQWAVLGLIYDAGRQGVRMTKLAKMIDTTNAFVTNNVNLLESRGLVMRTVDNSDTRSRIVAIVPKAKKQIERIEQDMRAGMRHKIYKDITREELAVYVKVLGKISQIDKLNNDETQVDGDSK